jgi:hypothetical protein
MPSPNTIKMRENTIKPKVRIIPAFAYDIFIAKQNKQTSRRDRHRMEVKNRISS